MEIRKAAYGLPQDGSLANKLLKERLTPAGYFRVTPTPVLWTYMTRFVQSTLVVDNFGVKFTSKEHVDHLIRTLKNKYKITMDWTGGLYCGITLQWDYNQRTLDFSMPGYYENK